MGLFVYPAHLGITIDWELGQKGWGRGNNKTGENTNREIPRRSERRKGRGQGDEVKNSGTEGICGDGIWGVG